MSKHLAVAAFAAFGLMSSTFALAEVTADTASPVKNALETPVLVAADLVANDSSVEPGNTTSSFVQPGLEPAVANVDEADTLAELVSRSDGNFALDAEAKCLATAVYYEARSESLNGQLAVANVVLQRARSGRFPTSLCGVVTQRGQFSFVRAGRLPEAPGNAAQWRTAKAIAHIAQQGSWDNPVEGALYFHATRVAPGWDRERVTRIGGHVFYR